MTRQVPTRRLTRSDAADFLSKAEEFLDAAQRSIKDGRFTAATACAVHAGINACDAITGFALGLRSTGKNHEQLLVLLRDVPHGKSVIGQMRPLLKLKPRAEYEPTPMKSDAAGGAVQRAARLVELAREAGAGPR